MTREYLREYLRGELPQVMFALTNEDSGVKGWFVNADDNVPFDEDGAVDDAIDEALDNDGELHVACDDPRLAERLKRYTSECDCKFVMETVAVEDYRGCKGRKLYLYEITFPYGEDALADM